MSWWCHRSQRSFYGEGGTDVRAEGSQLPWKPREHRQPAGRLHCRRWEEQLLPRTPNLVHSLGSCPSCICTCLFYIYWLILFYGNRYYRLERLCRTCSYVLMCWLAPMPSQYWAIIKNLILDSQYHPAQIMKTWCSLTGHKFTALSINIIYLSGPSHWL